MKKAILHILPMLVALWTLPALANGEMKPFVLASKHTGEKSMLVGELKGKLASAGFEVVGEYSPYPTVSILVVTNDVLKSAAAASEYGAYGAVQRVSVTEHNGELQVAYTNPVYMAQAYQLSANLADVATALNTTLGDMGQYGPAEGMKAKDLRGYHYMFGMPYLDDPDELAEFNNHAEAVAAIEKGLAAGNSGTSKVYRIDLGNNKTLFGVAMTKGMSSDTFIMNEIDFKDIRSSAHLPYEILVDGDSAYALRAEFRIAINFPDLKMMGSNSFMNIMASPDAIRSVLSHAAGVDPDSNN
ncbi:MAG: hypothetical protein OEX03_04265 [Gammaproteobacteria bacterium]|nr:hypothetical protein [Gammaproteobacteria bacterium]